MRASSVEPRSSSSGKVASVELSTTPARAPRLDDFFVFANDALAGDGGNHFQISLRPAWRIQETTVSSTSKGTLFFRRQRKSRQQLRRRGAEDYRKAE